MTASKAVSRFAENAMERHKLTPESLARNVGCSLKSINGILEERPVKLDQEQYFNLFMLAGVIRCVR